MKGVFNNSNNFQHQSPTKQEPQHDWWHLSQSPQQATSQGVKWASFMPESCALIEDNPSLKQECENHFAGQPTQHLLPNNPRHKAHKAGRQVTFHVLDKSTRASPQGVH